MRNDVRPVFERLVVMLLKLLTARFHLDQHAVGPEKVGKLLSTFRAHTSAVAFDQLQLRRAGFLCNAKFKRRSGLDHSGVTKRTEKVIEKRLRLAFFVAL